MKTLFFTLLLSCLLACNGVDTVLGTDDNKSRQDATSYSYACLDSSVAGERTTQRISKAADLVRDLAVRKGSITDEMQSEYGAAFHQDVLETGEMKLVGDKALDTRLNAMLNELLRQRTKPSGIKYAVYAVEDTMVNAFTFGGRIYVTRGMLNQCKGNDALLYAIIGHEVGHNEVGHIRATIQDMRLTEKLFGEGGGTFMQLKQLLAASFNQKNELEADYYGINLTHHMGLDLCTVVSFWRRMAGNENPYSRVEDFLRTHPFSAARAQCLADHIQNNFGVACGTPRPQELHPPTGK
ncbi:M48 family metallopeptidase [Flaviaesturariibacter flavus]|nr:M48 family metallopeptidase [Flaviaesturariibacter flavus]